MEQELIGIVILVVAILLDTLFGDPQKLPHLIVGYGKLISFFEKGLNKGNQKLLKGLGMVIVLVTLSFIIPFGIIAYFQQAEWWIANILFSSIMLFYCLANKTLVKEGKAVLKVLEKEGLEAGRKRLSWIVGRDTTNLDEQSIKRATFETLSENLSDGVIAPLFFFACFGVPGAMAYKMINTLDSMVGYKNEKYHLFGKFSAKLDDVVNYIPARLTAIFMLLVSFRLGGLIFVFREGKKHSSPNAAYPEAALAYILNCRFGGPNYYGGKLVYKPYIGENNRPIEFEEINRVASVNYKTTFFTTFLIIGLFYFLHLYPVFEFSFWWTK